MGKHAFIPIITFTFPKEIYAYFWLIFWSHSIERGNNCFAVMAKKAWYLWAFLLQNKINITIENLKENDYNYSITRDNENSDSFLIRFDFKESVRGNPSLRVNFNFKQEEKLDPDFFFTIKNVLIETKLNDYYPLSTSSQKVINTTTKITSTLNVMGTVIASSVVISNPGASFSVTCLLAIGMLKYLRHLPIDYPPNLIAIFSSFEEFAGTWEGLYYKDKGEDGEFLN